MTKPPKKPKPEDVETEPGAWERFERTMEKIVPPKPHKPKKAKMEKHKAAKK